MKRNNRVAALVLLFVLISVAPSCSYQLVRNGQVNQNIVNDMEKRVSAVRGLPFIKPVEIEVITGKQAETIFAAELKEEYPPEKIHALEYAYARIGLVEPGFDLGKLMVQYYSKNVAGFYDPKTKKLYLMKNIAGRHSIFAFIAQRDSGAELTLAHELTHALEDQHFDLEAMDKANETNDDASIAVQAMGEGSATVVSILVISPKTTINDLIAMLGPYRRMTEKVLRLTAGSAPQIFIDSLVFAYGDGAIFIADLVKTANNWNLVNQAYRNPPKSSETVLYPDKFIQKIDPPVEIKLPVNPKAINPDWATLEENTLGELGIFSLLRRFVDESAAKSAAKGWGGDRYAVVGTPDGKKTLWVWVTEWDSDKEAMEFQATYRSALERKYRGIKQINSPLGSGECWENLNHELIWVNRVGSRVSVIDGADNESLPIAVKWTIPSVIAQKTINPSASANAAVYESALFH